MQQNPHLGVIGVVILGLNIYSAPKTHLAVSDNRRSLNIVLHALQYMLFAN
jgi:hypothetical protein